MRKVEIKYEQDRTSLALFSLPIYVGKYYRIKKMTIQKYTNDQLLRSAETSGVLEI